MHSTKQTCLSLGFFLSILALTFSNCTVTIPATDNIKPRIELRINGPSVNETMTNPPTESWTGAGGFEFIRLTPGAEYNFSLLVSDQGGVERAAIFIPDIINITETGPRDVIRSNVGIRTALTIQGSRSNPLSGLTITGKFIAPGPGNSFEINIEADDFGGSSGRSNQRFMGVSIGS